MKMNIRKITSLTALLSFTILALTGIVLYIEPHGRVAYWVNWRLWGLTKPQWDNIHINVALLFLLSISLHIYLNWKVIISYLKHKTSHMRIFNAQFTTALLIITVFVVGTHMGIPPFRWVLQLNESVKESGVKKYGKPPYGHAELSSMETLAVRMGLDLAKSRRGLEEAGIKFEDEKQNIKEIAVSNDVTPQQVYEAMKSAQERSPDD